MSFALTHIWKGVARFTRKGADPARRQEAPFGFLGGLTAEEQQRRTRLLQALYREHTVEASDDEGEIFYPTELPPAWWVNERLEARGERWRVTNIDGFRCEAYDIK